MKLNALLRDGRDIPHSQISRAEKLEDLGICSVESYSFVNCVDENDDDYLRVRDSDCGARVILDGETSQMDCPDCHRTVYLDQKRVYEGERLRLNKSGLREFVRDLCKESESRSVHKRRNNLKLLEHTFSEVNVAEVGDGKVTIPIITEAVPDNVLDVARVVNDRFLWILVGEALPLRRPLDELDLNYLTIGNLVDSPREDAGEQINDKLYEVLGERDTEHLDIATKSAIKLCTSQWSLEQMGWDEFENCVHTMLQYCFRTSYLFGELERGSGYPDGALTLHWSDESLFMWDAKFVDLEANDETDLSGEYDKIFRHLEEMDSRERYQREFDGVAGVLLFSPGIKEANVRRLAEVIQERQIPDPKKWAGSIVYFELGSLVHLTESVMRNRADVRHKPNEFRHSVHAVLTTSSKHEDDPEKVRSMDFNSTHISTEDVDRIFEYLSRQPSEHQEFNQSAYMRSHEFFHEI